MTTAAELATAYADTLSAACYAPCTQLGGRRLGSRPLVQHDIMNEGDDLPQFARALQNITATAMLLRGVPEPIDPQEREVYRNLRVLVEATTIQQAESSTS